MVEADRYRSGYACSGLLAEVTSAANLGWSTRIEITKRTQFGNPFTMASYRQIEANRRNALKSTGPRTEAGKRTSRCNAVRHGLTAETVLGALEDAEDYKAFELAIAADFDVQSAIERELVLQLASILWRLRRATKMETGLFEIQANHLLNYRENCQLLPDPQDVIHHLLQPATKVKADNTVEFARCFLRLANLPNFALDRLSRYEATLWRQVGRTIYALEALERRKPQERVRCRCQLVR